MPSMEPPAAAELQVVCVPEVIRFTLKPASLPAPLLTTEYDDVCASRPKLA